MREELFMALVQPLHERLLGPYNPRAQIFEGEADGRHCDLVQFQSNVVSSWSPGGALCSAYVYGSISDIVLLML
jgi:hypothetical protein